MPHSPLNLSHLLRLDQQLRRDQSQSLRSLQERDRAIGASRTERSIQGRLLAWLNAVANGQHRSSIESALPLALMLAGLLAGIMAMSSLLLVDQQRPVNILVFLAIFVGLQWLLLLLTLIASLLLSLRDSSSLFGGSLNIIHWLAQRSYRRLAQELRPDQFQPLLRWLMLSLGQMFAVCFNVGALLALFMILLVMDRSFGWSSTLDISTAGLHQLLHVLSAPWSWFWPAAGVNMDLVESTRYQSLQVQFATEQVRAMRAWWPFLCACLLIYGLLPRLLLWVTFHCIYRWRLRLTFINYPGARLVLGRMDSPLVHTQASGHEQAETMADSRTLRRSLPEGKQVVVDWSGALAAQADDQRGRFPQAEPIAAGIHLNEDAALLERINRQGEDVLVLVKSWEPPLGELGDFLRGISPKLNCYLYLLSLPGQGIKAEALADWQHFARQGHHPRLVIVATDEQAGVKS